MFAFADLFLASYAAKQEGKASKENPDDIRLGAYGVASVREYNS